MKILTILGTRPEIIRLSLIIKKLDQLATKHILVHTGQNHDHSLSNIFFEELGIRLPDYHFGIPTHSLGQQLGAMFSKLDKVLRAEQPDRILVLGDTNSALCTILTERMGIPTYHMEAGNRCFDTNVPEEINRKIIDSIASINMPYTLLSRENLLREGIPSNRIWVSGNPIFEVLQHYRASIDQSMILEKLGLKSKEYLVVTTHRTENVDYEPKLKSILHGLKLIAEKYSLPIICSMHTRTKSKMEEFNLLSPHPNVHFLPPFGFFDFIQLQKNARCIITDSGTVQEESCLLRIPSVTIRTSTERPETVTCGSNVNSGIDATNILQSTSIMMQSKLNWVYPEGYEDLNVSSKVVNMILGGIRYV